MKSHNPPLESWFCKSIIGRKRGNRFGIYAKCQAIPRSNTYLAAETGLACLARWVHSGIRGATLIIHAGHSLLV